MKKTILISLLAFMLLPLMAQKPALQDCNMFTMEQPGQVTQFIYTNRVTGDIEYRGHEGIMETDINGQQRIIDPISGRVTPIPGETSGGFASLGVDFALTCWCDCSWEFSAPFTVQCFDCPYCSHYRCGGEYNSCGNGCSCRVVIMD